MQNVGLVVFAVVVVYALIYRDVVARAREAYQEAEKYMEWHGNPELKKTFVEGRFNDEKDRLEKLREKNQISEEEFKEKIDIAEFDRDFLLGESSLKYAYQWYKDTFELFSPPESKWVRMAREKAPEALNLWKEELKAQKIPFEDYMFE